MNFDEMVAKVLPIFPYATFAEIEGEIVISTNMALYNDQIVEMEKI